MIKLWTVQETYQYALKAKEKMTIRQLGTSKRKGGFSREREQEQRKYNCDKETNSPYNQKDNNEKQRKMADANLREAKADVSKELVLHAVHGQS